MSQDKDLENYLHGKSDLSQVYADLPEVKLPDHLDQAILAEAHRAVRSRPGGRRSWLIPTSIAASLFVAVILGLQLPYLTPGSSPEPEGVMDRQDSAASAPRVEWQNLSPHTTAERKPTEQAPAKQSRIADLPAPAPAPAPAVERTEITAHKVPAENRKAQAPAAVSPPSEDYLMEKRSASPGASAREEARRIGSVAQRAEPPHAGEMKVTPVANLPLGKAAAQPKGGKPVAGKSEADILAADKSFEQRDGAAPAAKRKQLIADLAEEAPPSREPMIAAKQNGLAVGAVSTQANAAPSVATLEAQAPSPTRTREQSTETPAAWLKRIVKLRKQGKVELARKELAAFRKLHPTYELPRDLQDLADSSDKNRSGP